MPLARRPAGRNGGVGHEGAVDLDVLRSGAAHAQHVPAVLRCDAGVAQACKPAEGFGTIARFSIPKIDACPAPFGS